MFGAVGQEGFPGFVPWAKARIIDRRSIVGREAYAIQGFILKLEKMRLCFFWISKPHNHPCPKGKLIDDRGDLAGEEEAFLIGLGENEDFVAGGDAGVAAAADGFDLAIVANDNEFPRVGHAGEAPGAINVAGECFAGTVGLGVGVFDFPVDVDELADGGNVDEVPVFQEKGGGAGKIFEDDLATGFNAACAFDKGEYGLCFDLPQAGLL